ncbi:MAG: hypothetical protein ACN4GR_01045 [Arenicellales bacterium]
MGPFMQELVSFISIMLGTVVLTAWVMWILLRPSGDNKVEEFASRSARDGLTEAVMENNELKNKVTQLERELKLLMSEGYPGKPEDEEQEAREKGKGERLESKDEGLRTKDEEAQSRSAARRGGLNSRDKAEVPKTKGEREGVEEENRKAQENLLRIKELESQIQENEARVKAKTEAAPSPEVVPLSEAPRVTNEAEKKKIADYLASVAETTERQMKEVKALDEMESRYSDDNLKKIKGIGPHLEGRLKKEGISSYQQIADFNEDEIRRVSTLIGSYPRRIRREGWVEQAAKLIDKG